VSGWRIDDLAQRAGLTVDTIRFYQREGLLPPAEREGRTKRYGPVHLTRLEQIRDLQARRFSLAAIRALLESERQDLVDGIFAGDGSASYTLDDLLERSGADPELVGRLRGVGLLRDPVEFGRDAYDALDLDLLRAVAELGAAALPDEVIVELVGIYVRGVEAMQREVLALFSGQGTLHWDAEDLARFQASAAASAGELLPLVTRVVDYVHQRTLQRLTLGAIERSQREQPPAGA
jgi:DNA-binding transcriptional MerR regulator